MARYERFSFLCNQDERRLITVLAKKLQRSQSDAVRFVVINAVKELQAHEQQETHPISNAAGEGTNG
jgi:hypothetical protein